MTSGVLKGTGPLFDQLVESFVADNAQNAGKSADAKGQTDAAPIDLLFSQAEEASSFMKALAHEGRLMILCSLVHGEKSVTELENLLNSRQAAVSQQLARLRLEGIVTARRDGKAIYYSLSDPKAQQMIALLYTMFCLPD